MHDGAAHAAATLRLGAMLGSRWRLRPLERLLYTALHMGRPEGERHMAPVGLPLSLVAPVDLSVGEAEVVGDRRARLSRQIDEGLGGRVRLKDHRPARRVTILELERRGDCHVPESRLIAEATFVSSNLGNGLVLKSDDRH